MDLEKGGGFNVFTRKEAAMAKKKAIATIAWAVVAIGATTATSASAAPAGWMVNGTNLEESTAGLASTAAVDKNYVLSGGGLTLECSSSIVHLIGPILQRVRGRWVWLELTIWLFCSSRVAQCSIPTTLGTVPYEAEITLNGTTGDSAVVHPKEGTVFTTIKVTGEGCAAEGNKPVTGDYVVSLPTGQEERTLQLLEINQAATGLLKLGSASASLSGSALVKTESARPWSFL